MSAPYVLPGLPRRIFTTNPATWRRRLTILAGLARLYHPLRGWVVRSGPFAGMRYAPRASWGAVLPRIVGCYEEELHPVVEWIVASAPHTILDIGCAEGYYAVGLARRLPNATIHAFDVSEDARRLCTRMAERNGVADRVRVGGLCDHETIQTLASDGALIICDIEGAEGDLLDPEAAPALRRCSILVETHDLKVPGVAARLRERFRDSHEIISISTVEHHPNRPCLRGLPVAVRRYAVSDLRRGPQVWLIMMPKTA